MLLIIFLLCEGKAWHNGKYLPCVWRSWAQIDEITCLLLGVRLHTSTLPEPHLVGALCTGLPAFSFMGSSHLNLLAGSNSGHHDSMNFVIFSNIPIVESIENQRQLQVPKTGTRKQAQKITTRRSTLGNRQLEGRTPSGSK